MRFTLCTPFLAAFAVLYPQPTAAQKAPLSATEHFERGRETWLRSCAAVKGELCVRRKTIAAANNCSRERHATRVWKRKPRLVASAARDLGRAVELATAILASNPVTESDRADAERALAGATFFLAEAKMEKLLARPRLPELSLDPARPRRSAREGKRFKEWLEKTRAAVTDTEAAYAKQRSLKGGAVELQVASAARSAEIIFWFATLFTDAPVPGFIRRSTRFGDDMRAAYCGALEEHAEPLRQRAKAAREFCVELAERASLAAQVTAKCRADGTGAATSTTP